MANKHYTCDACGRCICRCSHAETDATPIVEDAVRILREGK